MKKVVVSAFMINERGHILMSRRSHSKLYCPPGGKVESYESLQEGLAREIEEEVNLIVEVEDMEFLGFCDLPEKVIFFYLIFRWSGKLKNCEPEKHDEWEWLIDTPENAETVEGIRWFNRELRGKMYERIRAAA